MERGVHLLMGLAAGFLASSMLQKHNARSVGHETQVQSHDVFTPFTWTDLEDRMPGAEDWGRPSKFPHEMAITVTDYFPESEHVKIINGFPAPKYLPFVT